MKLKKYFVYIEDGKRIYKEAVPAETAEAAEKYCEGNGEIIKIKDITEETPIDAVAVAYALSSQGFGEAEIDLITKTLTTTGIAE